MEVANINTLFPVELLHIVFAQLSPSDLKSALLVCRRWGRIGEHYKFWSWVTIQVTQSNLSVMTDILTSDRFKGVEELYAREVSEELLEAIDSLSGLKVLNLNHCDVPSRVSNQLAKIVSKMEEVDFEEAELAGYQWQEMFNFDISESKLKRLFMPGHDLTPVDPDILAKCVSNLEEVDLMSAEMTPLQCKTIFQFAARETKLVKLYIGRIDLSGVNPETLARVVSKLEEVILNDTHLTNQQCEKIFKFGVFAAKLKLLYISNNDLSTVDPHDLSVVVSKLKEVNLDLCNLIPDQCEEIFEVAAFATSKLKELDIIHNDLSAVNEDLLSKVVSKLKVVDLSYSELTPKQCEEIFIHLSRGSKMKEFQMSGNDLSEVDPELMASVISKFHLLELRNASMNEQQCKIIFENISSDCKLKKLDMSSNYLDEVDPEDLARVIPNLEKLNLRYTHLTTHQSEAIFNCVIGESKIKNLAIANTNLSSVNPELLAKAITELEEIDLSYTELTGEQCKEIFNWLIIDTNLKNLKMLDMFRNNMELVDQESIDKVSAKLKLII